MKRYIKSVTNIQVKLCQDCIRSYKEDDVELGTRSDDFISFYINKRPCKFDMKKDVTELIKYIEERI